MDESFMPAFFSEFQETSFKWQRDKDRRFLQLKVAAKRAFNVTFGIARMSNLSAGNAGDPRCNLKLATCI
ncbi:hypothetical protein Y5S_02478 [Alcanivorax nanhaiticus]|uniref:Uncharacterized protein n=1 Tax=Alcanivorax nanhaiticus TaxID=1177154 RepID=A0A095SHS4_9GAMM|nr:hypothetical protein [Alcanivorax nanhaiticus]KGD64176.1 hypothetical protein Y5S_02478 [Alcanivorax nanhaiticus]